MSQSTLVSDLQALVATPSVNPFDGPATMPPPEDAMARLYEQRLAELGLELGSQPVINGRRNVWGRLRGSGDGPTVMLAGHLDTVGVVGYDQPFEPRVENGRVYGRGSCDMKAGLAAYLEVVRRLQASGETLSGDLIIAGVVDEEHAMLGSKAFGEAGPHVDFAIIAEPSELAICPVHKGQMMFGLRTRGVSVHSSLPEKGVNAIFHMGRILRALEDHAAELAARPAHPLCGSPTLSVGVVSGGTNASSVPDWARIEVDRRTIPGEDHEAVQAELEAVVESVRADLPGLDYSFDHHDLNVPPLETPEDAATVRALLAASEACLGTASPVRSFSGSTDAPNFGCEAVICGPGALAQCHSLDEYVSIEQLEQAVDIYHRAVLELMRSA